MDEKKDAFRLFRIVLRLWKKLRDRFADALEITEERKAAIYIDLAKSTTLKDIVYWLQIFFSAGIATLGLVQNSPAVIIGAMLISPLMGPILSSGLALATGDLILGVRALASLTISTIGAVSFAVILVAFLPFKEVTNEIFNRTSPNTLDLGIALFSGAIGSVAICKEVKGVVTSIPGVAIAVALMPPLCVVGFGIGLALSFDFTQGLGVAGGGGLLYLTNLVAITFTAMVVFILLRIDTPMVREKVREWRETDGESLWWKDAIGRVPSLAHAREIRSISLRLLMILLPLLLIFIPLSQSYSKLKSDIQKKQAENKIQQSARKIWEDAFSTQSNGLERDLDELRVNIKDGKLDVYLRVIDTDPYTQEERNKYLEELAKLLDRREDSINLQLIEIPTSPGETQKSQPETKAPPPTLAEIQAQYLESLKNALTGLDLPPPAKMLDFGINTSPYRTPEFNLAYMSEREMDIDGQNVVSTGIKNRLNMPNAQIVFERIPAEKIEIRFLNNRAEFAGNGEEKPLDGAGKAMRNHTGLNLEISLVPTPNREELLEERKKAVRDYLQTNWSVAENRLSFTDAAGEDAVNSIRLLMVDQK
ncbi:MAG: DUF389 domain-containing protein [Pyrinomonadaceae bacterium]